MKIILNKKNIIMYLILLPTMKPGLFNQVYFEKVNSFYSLIRMIIFCVFVYKVFFRRRIILISSLFMSVIVYQIYILIVTCLTNISGLLVWAGPATAIMTVVLLFDYYEDEIIYLLTAIANILWLYFWINEITVVICVWVSGSTDAGLSFFNSQITQNQYFLGIDNRFINYFFPAILTNYIVEKNKNRKYIRTISIMIIGSITLIVLKAVGGIMGMVLLSFIITFMFITKRKVMIKAWQAIVVTIIISVLFVYFCCTYTDVFYGFFQNTIVKGSNYLDRVRLWKNVYEKVFLERPLTGIGTQSIKFMRYIMRYNHAHNLIMTLLLQGGLIGEVLWWRSIFIGTSKLNNAKSTEAIVVMACIIIEFLTNIMDSTNDSYFFILVAVAFHIDKIVVNTRFAMNE